MNESPKRKGPSLWRTAHGAAKKCGAVEVIEVPPLDELAPLDTNAARTRTEIEKVSARGRPFDENNIAAANRGSNLTRISETAKDPLHVQAIKKRAKRLKNQRERELEYFHGL